MSCSVPSVRTLLGFSHPHVWRFWITLVLCTVFSGCDPKERLLLVHIPSWPQGSTTLRLTVTSDGMTAQQVEVTEKSSQIGIYVPAAQKSALKIDARFRDGNGCRYGKGEADAELGSAFRIETTLKQTTYTRPMCRCSSDGWCFSNPLPQGNQLNRVWSNGKEVWAVGFAGTMFRGNVGQNLSQISSVTKQDLYGIAGASGATTSIWVVGAAGTSLVSSGNTFALTPTGTKENLRAVWAASPSLAFAVGDNGVVLRWNGTAWTSIPSGTTVALNDVFGTSPNDIWAIGEGGTVLHYDGTNFGATKLMNASLAAGFSTSATDAWIVGPAGLAYRWNGTAWNQIMPLFTDKNLQAVWGNGTSIWVAGDLGTIA